MGYRSATTKKQAGSLRYEKLAGWKPARPRSTLCNSKPSPRATAGLLIAQDAPVVKKSRPSMRTTEDCEMCFHAAQPTAPPPAIDYGAWAACPRATDGLSIAQDAPVVEKPRPSM